MQYFGSWTPQKVKDRVTEVLYGWTLWLKDEAKIQEAYRMLKKQGLMLHNHEGNSVCNRDPVDPTWCEMKSMNTVQMVHARNNKKLAVCTTLNNDWQHNKEDD